MSLVSPAESAMHDQAQAAQVDTTNEGTSAVQRYTAAMAQARAGGDHRAVIPHAEFVLQQWQSTILRNQNDGRVWQQRADAAKSDALYWEARAINAKSEAENWERGIRRLKAIRDQAANGDLDAVADREGTPSLLRVQSNIGPRN